MSRTLTQNALRSIHALQTSEVWLVLLTISSGEIPTLRFVNNNVDVVSRGQTFLAFPFEIVLPQEDADAIPRAQLRIDNVDKRIVEAVRQITLPPTLAIEIAMASNLDNPELSLIDFTLRNVQYDAGSVTGELYYESLYAEPVTYTMTPSRFPGLF